MIKTPKIEFVYSFIYDRMLNKNKKLASRPAIFKTIKDIEKLWKKEEKKILTEIVKVTSSKWKEDKIKCYIISNFPVPPFSDPLTMPLPKKKDYIHFIDTLVHELLHQKLIQEDKYFDYWDNFIEKKFKDELFNTKVHILVHAIHKHIYLKFYNKKRLQHDINYCKKIGKGYSKAWAIVNKHGYKNIIKEFKNNTK